MKSPTKDSLTNHMYIYLTVCQKKGLIINKIFVLDRNT